MAECLPQNGKFEGKAFKLTETLMRGWQHLWFEAQINQVPLLVSLLFFFYKPPRFPWAWYLISKHSIEHICFHGRNLNSSPDDSGIDH